MRPQLQLWIRQIAPHVIQQTIAVAAPPAKSSAPENPQLPRTVDPIACAPTRAREVIHVGPSDRCRRQSINAVLVNGAGALNPGPLAASEHPQIAQRTVRGGVEALPAE